VEAIYEKLRHVFEWNHSDPYQQLLALTHWIATFYASLRCLWNHSLDSYTNDWQSMFFRTEIEQIQIMSLLIESKIVTSASDWPT
jgi:hypothetical protein